MPPCYNPPPAWPTSPAGWSPPPGWQLWVDERPEPGWLRVTRRIYLGPAYTPPGRKLVRAGLLSLLTLGVLSAPLQRLDPVPTATERVTLHRSPVPGGTAGAAPTTPPPSPLSMSSPAVTVTVTVFRMLDLSGQDGVGTQQRLHELGVRTVAMKSTDGKTVRALSKWIVVGQSHLPGEEITEDTTVTLMLSQDPAAHLRSVPTKPPEPPAREATTSNSPVTPPLPEQTTSSSAQAPGTDPRFGTCREANAHGYEDYRQGVDVEYDWYEDRDGDGQICERR